MEEKHYLIKLLTNAEGAVVPSAEVYNTLELAQVAYHNTLASYHNAQDVLYAVVEILNYIGYPVVKEIVDHRPEPEPEPEEG